MKLNFAIPSPLHFALSILLLSLPLQVARGEVSFTRQVAPILLKKCGICHGAEKTKGQFRVDTFGHLFKSGSSEEAPVIAGKPEASLLYRLLVTADSDDRMPQKDDPLPASEIQLIRQWIVEGARFDGEDPAAPLSSLIPRWPHPAPPTVYPGSLPVIALAFSGDSQMLASSGYHELLLWNPNSGELIRRITNLPQRVQAIAFHPSNELVAAAGGTPGQSGTAGIYHRQTGALIQPLASAGDAYLCLAFSPDGERIAIGGTDNSIQVFSFQGKKLHRIQQHADWVTHLAFDASGKHLASASRDRSARIYQADKGELETTYQDHGSAVWTVDFAGEELMASGGRDKKIHLWKSKDGKKSGELAGINAEVLKMVVSGDRVFSAAGDLKIREHALKEKKLVHTYDPLPDAIQSLAFDPKEKRLAAGLHNGEIILWDAEKKLLIRKFIAIPGTARLSEGK